MPVPPGCADMIREPFVRGRFIWWLEVTQESRELGLWWRGVGVGVGGRHTGGLGAWLGVRG